jgi:GLPGLI family protein
MENGEMKRETLPDTAAIVAWFCTDIPVPVGPEMQGQLPGAILEMDINNGQIVYTAIEISDKVNPKKVAPPKGGKKMTAAEFTIEREALMKEMRGNMQIRRTINVQ